MNKISGDIFKAIHEGKWLSISYKNKELNITNYWIGIQSIVLSKKMLRVEGLHLVKHTLLELDIYIESIQSSAIVEGTYYPVNPELVEDIRLYPDKYKEIFTNIPNLKILNYLVDCSRLDAVPYKKDYALITRLDQASFKNGALALDKDQFSEIIREFQKKTEQQENGRRQRVGRLGMNVLSINTKEGLYVLAYRKLFLDISRQSLVPAETVTICWEFTIDGMKQSVRKYMDPGDYGLLEQFVSNQELIKDKITAYNLHIKGVDDMPYLVAIENKISIDLQKEYQLILKMYQEDSVSIPVKAFFGDLLGRNTRRKAYPITLLNKRVNLDQMLAIHNAMKYPVTYVQGPPGTGKTNTIVNTIATAFFNEKTVLFTAYNNHPIDGVFESLQKIKYNQSFIPFPIVRLGNQDKNKAALKYMKGIYERTKSIQIFSNTLQKNKDNKISQTQQLSQLLKNHEEFLDLKEREEVLKKLIEDNRHLLFVAELQGEQLYQVQIQLKQIGRVTDEQALELLKDDIKEFHKYLYYTSAIYIKRLDEPKNQDLLKIIYLKDPELQLQEFESYLKKEENVKKLLRIFPVVATTCMSACKLGEPKTYFDMVIMDEASQCNVAVGLVPIIRGKNLMLVGDPQQLNPVILLDPKDNLTLRNNYAVTDEYDYIDNSIYKTFLASDSVSDEILLSSHYRCNRKIIDFNNKKYYNNKLNVLSRSEAKEPLIFWEMGDNQAYQRNTAPKEALAILDFIKTQKNKSIGIITPFANQKGYIEQLLKENQVDEVTCGTVHAFQGDEKDIILFSTALTDQTWPGTYDWLKNNKELINVATSRAKEQLILLGSSRNIERLCDPDADDDLFELVQYVKSKGVSRVTSKAASSRALGIKPYRSETEAAFLENLNHALDNILYSGRRCVIHNEVAVSHVFMNSEVNLDLFYSARFDFVVYEQLPGKKELPILAIELDGKEHVEQEVVVVRDKKKQEICRQHGFELIRVENSYARRYEHIKRILTLYFKKLYKI
ncbi:MAG: DEAD/DEAH box helicase [Lachnospiraceae bacterium]